MTIALLLSLTITTTFANNNEEVVNYKTLNAFKKEFATASDVKWEAAKDFVKATFRMNNQVMMAYYNPTGELLAITRNLQTTQLPINLMTDIKKNYGKAWVSDLFELTSNDETSYYVTLQDADQTIVLKSYGTLGWSIYKKEKKDAQ